MKSGKGEGYAAKYNFVKRHYNYEYEKEPWYFGDMTREDAEDFLRNRANSDGSFLVRHSSNTGAQVLSLKYFDLESEVKHKYSHHPIKTDSTTSVWITKDPNDDDKYKDLSEMIEAHRKKKRQGLKTKLTSVCAIPSPHTDANFDHYRQDHISHCIPQHQIQSERVLSFKGSGVVEKARLQGFIDVVVKPLKFQFAEDSSGSLKKFFKDVGDLNRLDHPNVVQLFGFTTNDEKQVFLIPGLMARGHLKDQLQKMWKRGDSGIGDRLFFWAVEVARGMKRLESLGIVHGDLAAR